MSGYEHVVLSSAGAISTVAINRPASRNALVRGTGLEVFDALSRVANDKSVRVVIFRGVGDDFCCGADLKTAAPPGPKPQPAFDAYQVTALLHAMPQVSVAAIRGGCAGAGFGWACACDFRVGDDTAVMNTAFLDVGVAGDMGVPWTLPRLIGSSRARDLMFFPRKVRAAEAQSIALLDRLWSADAFEAELDRFTQTLANAAPLALTAMKANFVQAEHVDLSTFIAIEAERHIRLLDTADRHEAFRAWIEKRRPDFIGG